MNCSISIEILALPGSAELSSLPPPTQDLTITLGEGMRRGQEKIETLLPWTTNTCVWCLLVHYSLTRKKSRHGTKKLFFKALAGKPAQQKQVPKKFSILEGPTRKPRHASVLSTHSDTQEVPAFHCKRMFKGIFFDTLLLAFLKRTDTLSTIA